MIKYRIKLAIPLFLILISLLLNASISRAQAVPSFVGQIAYVGSDYNIWIIQGDNGEHIRVTSDSSHQIQYLSPRYSPDGTMLAYCQRLVGEQTTYNLFITRISEWQPILITDDIHCKGLPNTSYDWSPDSKKIIYNRPSNLSTDTRIWENYHGIWLVDITTGETSEVIPPPDENPLTNPHWSPEGAWIKFYEISYFAGMGSLMMGENQSGTIYSWLGASSLWPGASDWSPDGTQIVFDEIPYSGFPGAGIYLSSPNGENIRKIYASDGGSAWKPLWSPDGNTIAFLVKPNSGGPRSLVLVAPDGSNPRTVFSSEGTIIPSVWSPDGSQILFGSRSGNSIELLIHDLNDGSIVSIGLAGAWGADWSQAIIDDGQEQETVVIPDFPYSESLLLYVAPDHRLVLYDPNDGSEIDLTDPLTVSSFWPSPSGRHLVYGRHLVSLEFEENEEFLVKESLLPATPVGERINWSSNEERISFIDWRGRAWIADLNGEAQLITGATSIPNWSADGALISFCTEEGNLRVIGGAVQTTDIASHVDCDVQWSPSRNILAFTQIPTSENGEPGAYLYNSNDEQTTLVLGGGEVLTWSPDGKLLALKSTSQPEDPSSGYEIFVTNLDGDKLLKVGDFQENGMGLSKWIPTDNGYLYGKYAIAPDLSASYPIADALLGYSQNGSRLLVSNTELHLQVLACRESATGEQERLLTVDLTEMPEEGLPGIWGWLSPDGNRVVNRSYIEGNFANLLLDCSGERRSNLPFPDFPNIAAYSDDGNWFVVTTSQNGNQQHILLSNLAQGGTERVSTVSGSNFTWLHSLHKAGIHTISGQVKTKTGQPLANVSVFVEGILITSTNESGFFTITRLVPGEYKITLQKPDYDFSPSSYKVTVPPDITDVDIQARESNSRSKKATPTPDDPYAAPETSTGSPPVDNQFEAIVSTIMPYIQLFLSLLGDLFKGIVVFASAAILPLFDSGTNRLVFGLVALALVILALSIVIFRRYRRGAIQGVTEPASPESPPPAAETDLPLKTSTVEAADLRTEEPPGVEEPQGMDAPSLSAEQIEQQMRHGMTLVRDGNYEEGHRTFRQIVQQNPDQAGAWLWLGYLAARKEDWRAAERCFRLAKKYHHPKADRALEWLQEQNR